MLVPHHACPLAAFLAEIVYYQGMLLPRGVAIESEHSQFSSVRQTLTVAALPSCDRSDYNDHEILDPDIARAALEQKFFDDTSMFRGDNRLPSCFP